MKNIITIVGIIIAVSPAWSAALENPRPVALERITLESVKEMGIVVPEAALAKAAAGSTAVQAAEVSYVRANLFKKLNAEFTSLCAAEGLSGDLAPAKTAELYRRAVEAIKKEKDPAAPSAKAFDTLVYVAERLTWIFDGAAETATDAGDFERLAAPPAQRILESVLHADSLALMRSDSDIIASQFLNNRTKAAVADQGWKHANVQAAGGEKIAVDYQLHGWAEKTIASPIWVNISAGSFNGSERIGAVLLNYYDGSGMPAGQLQSSQRLDLVYAGGGRYTAAAQPVVVSESHIGYGYNFRQEIAVVVDGKWLVDPVSGGHNFKFGMSWY